MEESFKTKVERVVIEKFEFDIKMLVDNNQYCDPRGLAKAQGMHENEWSHFGVLWPSGYILAQVISRHSLKGLKILELGCGLGLASLVAQKREANITASDRHPLTKEFLDENARLNQLPKIKYVTADWNNLDSALDLYDLIIGSDLVYDKKHPKQLSHFIDKHLGQFGEVIIIIPGREHCSKFINEMTDLNFYKTEERFIYPDKSSSLCRGRILKFKRSN